MPLIEGIGDEVTFILGGFLLCIILMLAWFSTHTSDIPLIREVGVIVVELSQRRSRTRNNAERERSGGDDVGGFREGERTLAEVERQGDELDNRSSETLDSLVSERSDTENNIASAESIQTPSNESTLPDYKSEAQNALMSDNSAGGQKSGDLTQASCLEESETVLPKASVVVDDEKGFASSAGSEPLTDDEVRQRRVQYFETNKSGPATSTDNNTPSSLSEKSPLDDDNTRHSKKESMQLVYPPKTDQSKTTRGASEGAVSESTQEPHGSASVSPQQDVIDEQASAVQSDGAGTSRIRIRLKYMNETQRLVYASPYDTIGDFRRTHFQAELQENKWVRFIYNGQDLRDDARTLQACNIGDNCTMHCLITAQTRAAPSHDSVAEEDEDSFMGAMMYPLFTVVILIVWYFRFTYRQYFSAMSTVCLIGISFLLALSYISSLRTVGHTPAQQRAGPASVAAGGGRGGVTQEEHQHTD